MLRVSAAHSTVKHFPASLHVFVLRESFLMKSRAERFPSTNSCKSSSLFKGTCEKCIFLLQFRFPNTEQYTKPTGLFPLYMPGHHRRNYFSCFLVPGAGHSISALIPPKPSHVLSSGTPVEDLVGLATGHTAPLSRRPSFFPPPLRPLLSWAAAQHQHRLPAPAPQQLVCYPLRRCQVSGWSLGKRSPWAAESAVGAQDSVTWYEQPTLKSRADNPVPHVCQL